LRVEHVVYYLKRAIELGVENKGWDFEFDDIAWVEATWLLADCDSSSLGVVAKLKNGRRVYFDYVGYEEDGPIERVDIQALGSERYPDIGETGAGRVGDPAALNHRFAH
jgi:hypothetical protein